MRCGCCRRLLVAYSMFTAQRKGEATARLTHLSCYYIRLRDAETQQVRTIASPKNERLMMGSIVVKDISDFSPLIFHEQKNSYNNPTTMLVFELRIYKSAYCILCHYASLTGGIISVLWVQFEELSRDSRNTL